MGLKRNSKVTSLSLFSETLKADATELECAPEKEVRKEMKDAATQTEKPRKRTSRLKRLWRRFFPCIYQKTADDN